MSKQILWFVLVFSVFSFAEKDFDEARAEFVNPNLLVEYAQGGSR